MDVLEIKNLRFRYKNKFIFDDFNINIERGSWVTIAGPNGSGKTTLVKILAGLEKSYSDIITPHSGITSIYFSIILFGAVEKLTIRLPNDSISCRFAGVVYFPVVS